MSMIRLNILKSDRRGTDGIPLIINDDFFCFHRDLSCLKVDLSVYLQSVLTWRHFHAALEEFQ